MKRYLSLFLVIAMLVSMITIPSFADSTLSGAGTTADPYIIDTTAKLNYARDMINAGGAYASASYKLNANIDLGGAEWVSINGFSGTFDGNGKTITNAKQTTDSTEGQVGFFATMNGTVKNLTISKYNIFVRQANSIMDLTVGALAAVNNGSIIDCTVQDLTMRAIDPMLGLNMGGMVGSGAGSITGATVSGVTAMAFQCTGNVAALVAAGSGANIKNATLTNVTLTNTTCTEDSFVNGAGNGLAHAVYSGVTINGGTALSGEMNAVLPATYDIVGDAKYVLFGHNTSVANSNNTWAAGQYYYVSISAEAYEALQTSSAFTVDYYGFTTRTGSSGFVADLEWQIYHTFGTVLDGKYTGVDFFAAKTVNAAEGTAYYLGVYSELGYMGGDVAFTTLAGVDTFNVNITNLGDIEATLDGEYPTWVSGPDQVIIPVSEYVPPDESLIEIIGDAKYALFGHNTTVANSNQGWAAGQYYYVPTSEEIYNAILLNGATTVEYYAFTTNLAQAYVPDKDWVIYHTFGTVLDGQYTGVDFFGAKTVNEAAGTSYYIGIYSKDLGYAGGDIIFFVEANEKTFEVTITNVGPIEATFEGEYPTWISGPDQVIFDKESVDAEGPGADYQLDGNARLALFGFNTFNFNATQFGGGSEYYLVELTVELYNALTNLNATTLRYAGAHETVMVDIYHNFGTVLDGMHDDLKFFTAKIEHLTGDAGAGIPAGKVYYYLGIYTTTAYEGGIENFEFTANEKTFSINIYEIASLAAVAEGAYPVRPTTDTQIVPVVGDKDRVIISGDAKLVLFGSNANDINSNALQGSGQYYYVALSVDQYNALTKAGAITMEYNGFKEDESSGVFIPDENWSIFHNFGTILDGSHDTLKFFTAKTVNNGTGDVAYFLGLYSTAGYAGGNYSGTVSTDTVDYIISIASLNSIDPTPAGEYPVCVFGTDQRIFPVGSVTPPPASYAMNVALPSAVIAGQNVEVTVSLAELVSMTGILSVDFALTYDATAFTFVSMTHNAPASWSVDANDLGGRIKVLATDEEVANDSYNLTITLTFKATSYFNGTASFAVSEVNGSNQDRDYVEGKGSEASTAISALRGDVNGNGQIDSNDAVLVRSLYLGQDVSSDIDTSFADVNGNGKIDSNDYVLIRMDILGKRPLA